MYKINYLHLMHFVRKFAIKLSIQIDLDVKEASQIGNGNQLSYILFGM
jgi:hypothetical protein